MLFVSIFCNMNNRYYNTGYIIKSSAKKYFATHKTMFVFLSLLFLVALITGVFTGIKGADNISINNINDKTLIKYFKGDSGPFAFFITRLLKYIFARYKNTQHRQDHEKHAAFSYAFNKLFSMFHLN